MNNRRQNKKKTQVQFQVEMLNALNARCTENEMDELLSEVREKAKIIRSRQNGKDVRVCEYVEKSHRWMAANE